jgi:hypothetical protein
MGKVDWYAVAVIAFGMLPAALLALALFWT